MATKSTSANRVAGGDDAKLSPAQEKVLTALTAGRSYVEAATEAEVSDRTIRRWRQDSPAFEHELRARIQDIRDAAAITASAAINRAIKTLAEIAADPAHPHVLRAIQMICDLAGPLQQVKEATTVKDVKDEQSFASFLKCVPRELR